MMDEGMEMYFLDMAQSALDSCEMMLSQGRKAKAQEYFTTALYFSAKVDADKIGVDFGTRIERLNRQTWS